MVYIMLVPAEGRPEHCGNSGYRIRTRNTRVGRAQEKLGREAEAIEAYEYVLAAWQDADPELRPRVEAARRAITRLSGAED